MLVHDGRIVAGLEEAKLARQPSGDRERFPESAIAMCCAQAGIQTSHIDHFVYYRDPQRRFRHSIAANVTRSIGRPLQAAYATLSESNILRRHLDTQRERNIEWQYADHMRSHASWSFLTSPHDSAAVLVLSGFGDPRTVLAGIGEGTSVRWLRHGSFPNSLGWLYAQVTQAVGLRPLIDEARLQWLSTAGEPEYRDLFKRLVDVDAKNLVRIDRDFLSNGFGPLALNSDFRSSAKKAEAKNVATSVQERLEEVCLQLADRLRTETRLDALCLAGGVAENTLLVTRLQQSGIFKEVHVPAAPGNTGAAGGAALDLWYAKGGSREPSTLDSYALGPEYSDQIIKTEIDACKVPSQFLNSEAEIINITSGLLAKGYLVGWFQGRTELGRRALGFRSVLADASNEFVQDNINRYLKRRESFHPFAVSVTREDAGKYFTATCPSNALLAAAARLKPDAPDSLPRFPFVDG